jgi:hypothetical protein
MRALLSLPWLVLRTETFQESSLCTWCVCRECWAVKLAMNLCNKLYIPLSTSSQFNKWHAQNKLLFSSLIVIWSSPWFIPPSHQRTTVAARLVSS